MGNRMSPKGAVIRPAQGEALGKTAHDQRPFGPKGQPFPSASANDWPFGPTDVQFVLRFPRASPWAGRRAGPSALNNLPRGTGSCRGVGESAVSSRSERHGERSLHSYGRSLGHCYSTTARRAARTFLGHRGARRGAFFGRFCAGARRTTFPARTVPASPRPPGSAWRRRPACGWCRWPSAACGGRPRPPGCWPSSSRSPWPAR